MDFTREPTIETIITPKEGYKLVIKSSKGATQEEYFVDAVEMVAFGQVLFFRSLERYKAFLLPVTDYEVVEVKEARIVLKTATADRSIKIGGGKESSHRPVREEEKAEKIVSDEKVVEESSVADSATESPTDVRLDKKRDRRKHYRKRRGREDVEKPSGVEGSEGENLEKEPTASQPGEDASLEAHTQTSSSLFSSLLQPPPTLISETIGRYRQNELFKNAFFLTEEEQYKPHEKVEELLNDDEEPVHLQEPAYDAPLEDVETTESTLEEHPSSALAEHSIESPLAVEQAPDPSESEASAHSDEKAPFLPEEPS